MLTSTKKLVDIGADFAICPDNTIHQAFDFVIQESAIPWIHIAEAVAQEAKTRGYNHLGITGTKYLMTGPVYREKLLQFDITCEIPMEQNRAKIDAIIFGELVNGVISEKSRLYFNEVIQELKNKGCDAVVLGCTEIPLIVDPKDCPLPTLDSTRLLARAAIKKALQ
jgi:aspartate racemase